MCRTAEERDRKACLATRKPVMKPMIRAQAQEVMTAVDSSSVL
jgi:hypothetical protein